MGCYEEIIVKGTEKFVAREIIKLIEKIYFSDEYRAYRHDWGSKGAVELIIQTIKDRYLEE